MSTTQETDRWLRTRKTNRALELGAVAGAGAFAGLMLDTIVKLFS